MKIMKKMVCTLLAMGLVLGMCVIPTEAKSGAEQVQDIQNAIDNAEDGGTVLIQEDVLWGTGEPIVISGKSVTIQLCDCTIESLELCPVFLVKSGAELTIDMLGQVINAGLTEGAEDNFSEQQLEEFGLFQVEENAKLILNGGTYTAGYKMFTGNSAGEIIINGGTYNMIPNGTYHIPDWCYFDNPLYPMVKYYSLQPAIDVNVLTSGKVAVEQNSEFVTEVVNKADHAIENINVQMGYSAGSQYEFYLFDDVTPSDKYTLSGETVNIPRIEAGETINVTFKGAISAEMLEYEDGIGLNAITNIMVNGESVDEQSGYMGIGLFQVAVDTKDPIVTDEVSKPVKDVTVVENKETESIVKTETVNVVSDILNGSASEEVVSTETATKVSEAINSGKSVQAEIVVKEMTTEEVQQITTTDKTAIENKVATELGDNANIQYLDLAIILKAGDEELGTLNKLEEEITITVAIPKELKADGRIYKVIRNHNGVVEVLDTVLNADGTVSFKTDRFSTYALAYADSETPNTTPSTTPSTTPVVQPSTSTTNTPAPQTGDNTSTMVYGIMCIIALVVVVLWRKRSTLA